MPKTAEPEDGRSAPAMLSRRDATVRERGAKAAREGKPESACPYQGFQGGYRARWLEGHREETAKGRRP